MSLGLSTQSCGKDFEDINESNARKAEDEASKKRGRAVEWKTKFEFREEEFVGSELDIKIKKEFIIHKKSTTKAGQITIYWCKYGKRRGFSCPVKFKVVRKDEKVFIMDEKDFKDHDHKEDESQRIYQHYTDDQVEAMKENIELDVEPRNIKKMLKNKGLVTDDSMPKPSSFYHKVNQLKKELDMDQVFVQFKRRVIYCLI